MTELTITQTRRVFPDLPEQLAKAPDRALGVTRRGRPVLAVLPWALYESLVETLEVLNDPGAVAALRASLEDVRRGRTVSHETARTRLGAMRDGLAGHPALQRSVSLDPARLGRDAGRVAEEVIAHRTGLVGAEIRRLRRCRPTSPSAPPTPSSGSRASRGGGEASGDQAGVPVQAAVLRWRPSRGDRSQKARGEGSMGGWLRCSVTRGMLPGEFVVQVRTSDGRDISLFAPEASVRAEQGLVAVRILDRSVDRRLALVYLPSPPLESGSRTVTVSAQELAM